MARDDSTNQLGLYDSAFGPLDGGLAVSDATFNLTDAPNHSLYRLSSTQVGSVVDAFDDNSIGTTPLDPDGSADTAWQLPTAFDQPPMQAQPQGHTVSSSLLDNCPPYSVSPMATFWPDVTAQSGRPAAEDTQPRPMTATSCKSASSDDSANDALVKQSFSVELAASVGAKDTRKRKASEGDIDVERKKTETHNIIEKRYRTNVNQKIAALRDSIPSLRSLATKTRGEDTPDDQRRMPTHTPNKATVFSKATEYIQELEKSNSQLLEENNAMKERIAVLENGLDQQRWQSETPRLLPDDLLFWTESIYRRRGSNGPHTVGST